MITKTEAIYTIGDVSLSMVVGAIAHFEYLKDIFTTINYCCKCWIMIQTGHACVRQRVIIEKQFILPEMPCKLCFLCYFIVLSDTVFCVLCRLFFNLLYFFQCVWSLLFLISKAICQNTDNLEFEKNKIVYWMNEWMNGFYCSN